MDAGVFQWVKILFVVALVRGDPGRVLAGRGLVVGNFAGRTHAALGTAPGVGETSWVAVMARTVRKESAEIAADALGRSVLAGRGAGGAQSAMCLRLLTLKVTPGTVPALISVDVPVVVRELA